MKTKRELEIPIALLLSDLHLREDNTDLIISIAQQAANVCNERGIKNIFVLGDVFHSRKAQTENTLNTLEYILNNTWHGLDIVILVGNHDKTNQSMEKSFLTPFKHIRNVNVVEFCDHLIIGDINCVFVSYFPEELQSGFISRYVDMYLNKNGKTVLLTHTAFNGAVNNDGSKQETKINYELVKPFDLCLSGHFHDAQNVYSNTYHLPSICQNNFGEDDLKGFTVLYSDLSMEHVQSNFKPYKTHTFEAKYFRPDVFVPIENEYTRIILHGTKSELEALDLTELKTKVNKIEKHPTDAERHEVVEEVITIDNKGMIDRFTEWAEENNLSVKEGLEILNKVLKK